MRFHLATIPLLFATTGHNVNAFTHQPTRSFQTKWTSTSLASQKSAEILAKAREAIGQDPVPVPDSKFDDDILEDMKNSLIFLEQRVKNGPGSFSMEEMLQFEAATSRIINEMNAHYDQMEETEAPAAPAAAPPEVAAVIPESSPVVSLEPPPPPPPMPSLLQQAKKDQKEILQNRQTAQKQSLMKQQEEDEPVVIDTSNDEGPAYEGKGGMGLAKGTTNTYVIPGMDEMTGEEYRKALQESVSKRQEERKKKYNGNVGNRAVNDYLSNL